MIMVLKKLKFFILFATVLTAVLLLVACGKDATEIKKVEDVEKPKAEVVVGISVDTTNAVLTYELGGRAFDIAGLALVKILDDGTEKLALVTMDMVTVPDMTTRGQKTVTVKYGEFSAEYTITVRELSDLSIDTSGVKTSFEAGEAFSAEGLIVKASFFDIAGTEEIAAGGAGGYTVTAPDMIEPGMKEVTVSYCGVERKYQIAVRKAPALELATLEKEGDKLYVKVEGSLEGYSSPEFGFDLQKLASDDYIRDMRVKSDYTSSDGKFTISAELGNVEQMTEVKDVGYMLHVIINGVPYDVVDIKTEANTVTEFGGVYYRLKSEKYFNDNDSKFVVLRAAANEGLLVPKSLTAQSVTIAVRGEGDDAKLGLVVTGEVSGLTLDGIVIQLREKDDWNNTIALDTTVEIVGDTFTAFAVIPDGDNRIHVGKVLFTRMLVPGYIDEEDPAADKELHDLPIPVKTTEIEFGTGKYTLKQEGLYDAKQLVTILYDTEAIDYTMKAVRLEKKGDRLYYVIEGSFEGSKEGWSPALDMQRTYDYWETFGMPTDATVEFGEGTFTVTQDITDFDFDTDRDRPYITHLTVKGHSGDVANIAGFEDMDVEFEKNGVTYTYKIYSTQIFAPDNLNFYICMRVESESVEYAMKDVRLEQNGGRLYYVIEGSYEGSKNGWAPSIDMERLNYWNRVTMDTPAKIEFGEGTFTITQDITDCAFDVGDTYITHLFVRGASNDVVNISGFNGMDIQFTKNGTGYKYSIYAGDAFNNGNIYVCFKVTTA